MNCKVCNKPTPHLVINWELYQKDKVVEYNNICIYCELDINLKNDNKIDEV